MSRLQSLISFFRHMIICLMLYELGNSTGATPITPVRTTVRPALSEKYDQVLVQPCGVNIHVTPSTVEGNITTEDLKKLFGVTKRLKRNLVRLKRDYARRNDATCGNEEIMNLQRKYLRSYCPIPSSSIPEDLSKSMMLTTKWLFWVSKAEREVFNLVSTNKKIEPFRFESTANFSKESLCALKTHREINETQLNEVITCQLPLATGISDPGDIVPVTCEVLDQLSSFVNKIHTSLCGLYSHIKPCSLRKRAIKQKLKKLRNKNKKKNKRRKNKRRKNKGKGKKQRRKNKKNKKTRKNKGGRKKKGNKGKREKNKTRKNNAKKRFRTTTFSPQ